jgi:hypothetical protein
MVAFVYPYQMILVPAIVIFLVSALALALHFPRLNKAIGVLLIAVGSGSIVATGFFASIWGSLTGLITQMMGISIISFATAREDNHRHAVVTGIVLFVFSLCLLIVSFFIDFLIGFLMRLTAVGLIVGVGAIYLAYRVNRLPSAQAVRLRFKRWSTIHARRALYASFLAVIIVCSFFITVRATKMVREEGLETYNFGDQPNITLRGSVISAAYNYEVNTGFSYHVFPAYVTFNVTQIVWGNGVWENQTQALNYLTRQDLVVYYEKTDAPNLSVGQQIEVSGHYCSWLEDSLYSETLVVSTAINGSYLNPL